MEKKIKLEGEMSSSFRKPVSPVNAPTLPKVKAWLQVEKTTNFGQLHSPHTWTGFRGWTHQVVWKSLRVALRLGDQNLARTALLELWSVFRTLNHHATLSTNDPQVRHSAAQSQARLAKLLVDQLLLLILEEVGLVCPWVLNWWFECFLTSAAQVHQSVVTLHPLTTLDLEFEYAGSFSSRSGGGPKKKKRKSSEVVDSPSQPPFLFVQCCVLIAGLARVPRQPDVAQLWRHCAKYDTFPLETPNHTEEKDQTLSENPASMMIGLDLSTSTRRDVDSPECYGSIFTSIEEEMARLKLPVLRVRPELPHETQWVQKFELLTQQLSFLNSSSSSSCQPSSSLLEWCDGIFALVHPEPSSASSPSSPALGVPFEYPELHEFSLKNLIPPMRSLWTLLERLPTSLQFQDLCLLIRSQLMRHDPVCSMYMADLLNRLFTCAKEKKSLDHLRLVMGHALWISMLYRHGLIPSQQICLSAPASLRTIWQRLSQTLKPSIQRDWRTYHAGASRQGWPAPPVAELDRQINTVPSSQEVTFLHPFVRWSLLHLHLSSNLSSLLPHGWLDLFRQPHLLDHFSDHTDHTPNAVKVEEEDHEPYIPAMPNVPQLHEPYVPSHPEITRSLCVRTTQWQMKELLWQNWHLSATLSDQEKSVLANPMQPSDGSVLNFQIRVVDHPLASRAARSLNVPLYLMGWKSLTSPPHHLQFLMEGPTSSSSYLDGWRRSHLINCVKHHLTRQGSEQDWLIARPHRLLALPSDQYSHGAPKFCGLSEFWLPIESTSLPSVSSSWRASRDMWPLRSVPDPGDREQCVLLMPSADETDYPVTLSARHHHFRQASPSSPSRITPHSMLDESTDLQELVFLHLVFRWVMGCSHNSFAFLKAKTSRPPMVISLGEDCAFSSKTPIKESYLLSHMHLHAVTWGQRMIARLISEDVRELLDDILGLDNVSSSFHSPLDGDQNSFFSSSSGASIFRRRWDQMILHLRSLFPSHGISENWKRMVKGSGFRSRDAQLWAEQIRTRLDQLDPPNGSRCISLVICPPALLSTL